MQTDRHESAARWRSLEAELSRTRAELAAATAQIRVADRKAETLEASNIELAEAKDDADCANQAKSEFLAAAGHDLRQPLQAMAALQALLADANCDTGSKTLIARLDTSLQAIGTLLDTLLDEDRIENGIARADLHSVPLSTLFAKLADAHGPAAEAAGIGLTFAPTHATTESDPLLLQQMLSNLIGNALRFTPHGKVLVGARERDERILIEVWDNGIGIAPDMADEIFKANIQVKPTEMSGGQGLGLSIVRSLGLLLDHPVQLRSVPGSGSVFIVDVPRAVPLAASPKQSPPKGHGRLVHVIDDDASVLESLCDLLGAAGHNVQTHRSGEEFLRDWQPERAACLLVDARLPGMDGLSLLGQLKTLNIMPPSIIITGKGDVATAAAAMRLGTLDFLEKPLPGDTLLESVANAMVVDKSSQALVKAQATARKAIDSLTKREREVLDMVVQGHPSKNISADLGISQRTVENHRAAMMRKTGSRSLASLIRLAIAAEAETDTPAS